MLGVVRTFEHFSLHIQNQKLIFLVTCSVVANFFFFSIFSLSLFRACPFTRYLHFASTHFCFVFLLNHFLVVPLSNSSILQNSSGKPYWLHTKESNTLCLWIPNTHFYFDLHLFASCAVPSGFFLSFFLFFLKKRSFRRTITMIYSMHSTPHTVTLLSLWTNGTWFWEMSAVLRKNFQLM